MKSQISETYPLGSFSRFIVKDLPNLHPNPEGNVESFLEKAVDLLPKESDMQSVLDGSINVAATALGDLGMFASVLSRHNIAIGEVIPDVVEKLLILGDKTGLPPRDNYYSYTEANFPGAHSRTYTGHSEEHLMVFYNAQFCSLFAPIIAALKDLATSANWRSASLNVRAEQAAINLAESAQLMLSVRAHVSSEVFSASRKYTRPIHIPGASWRDENGEPTSLVTNIDADSNIALIDLLLYGTNQEHNDYLESLYPYFPTYRRDIFNQLIDQGFVPIADRFVQERGRLSADFRKSILEIFRQMWGWRSIHNSAITTHLRAKGSGRNLDKPGFEYDSKIYRLLRRSKIGYDIVSS